MSVWIECVPNISEGRDAASVDAIIAAVKAVPGITWLDQSSDADHHRTVLTFLGDADALEAGVLALFEAVAKRIDMGGHSGNHPRMGAVDVVPFIPIRNATIADCVALSKRVGQKVAERFGVPVTLYEASASAAHRRNLATVRKGEFEGLGEKLAQPEWAPDFGPAAPHPKLGAVAMGAREALVAYNIYLGTQDLAIAKAIAAAIRGSSGGLAHVKALGIDIPERQQVQVSMNLVDFRKNPLYRVVNLVRSEAQRWGVAVTSTEIVGLVPQDALLESAAYHLQLEGYSPSLVLENRIADAMAAAAKEA